KDLVASLVPWLPVIVSILLILPISVVLLIVRVRWQAGWHPLHSIGAFSDADIAYLVSLAFLIAVQGMVLQRQAWRCVQARERQVREAEAIQIENDAVARVCRAVAREFVQPLSGALAYSELLLLDTACPSESQRRALDGLREGVSRLEYLVCSVRDAVQEEPMQAPGGRVADMVVHAVRMPVPRQPTPAREPARLRP
ncbi:MAG: hypothetical protein ACRDGS_04045, partial [Chloroflexota bacterium]